MKKLLLLGALALASLTSKAATVETYLDRSAWTVTACSNAGGIEGAVSGYVAAMIDDNLSTYYHQNWNSDTGRGTHWFIIDMGSEQEIHGVDIWGRQGHENGHIEEGKIYLSNTAFEAFADHDAAKAYYDDEANVPVATINYEYAVETRDNVQASRFNSTTARYILVVTNKVTTNNLCVAEVKALGNVEVDTRIDLDRTNWMPTACSEAGSLESGVNGSIAAMFDDDLSTFHHQDWGSDTAADAYHWFMIDLGETQAIDGFKYWRRQNNGNGQMLAGKIYVSNEPFAAMANHSGDDNAAKAYVEDATHVPAGEFTFTYTENPNDVRICDFANTATGRYVLVIATNEGSSGARHLCCAEFKLFKQGSLAEARWQATINYRINADKLTRFGYFKALGKYLGKTEPSYAFPPAGLTDENFEDKVAEANAALDAYCNSFENQMIYLRHGSRRGNAYLTAIPTGKGIKINTLAEPTADALWQIRFLNNNLGFYLYSRSTNTWLTTTGGRPAAETGSASQLSSRLDNNGHLNIVQGTSGNNLLNVDNSTNDAVWYSVANDGGSQWNAVAATVDNQVFVDPEVSTAEAPKYYRIVSARWMSKQVASNLSVNGENQDGDGNGEVVSSANATVPGIYWRIESNGDGVKLVNLTGYELTYEGQNAVTMTDNGSTFYLIKQTDAKFNGVNAYGISSTAEMGGQSCLDANNSANAAVCWSPTAEGRGNGDNGSAWYFLLASDAEVTTATETYINNVAARVHINVDPALDNLFGEGFAASITTYPHTVAGVNAAKHEEGLAQQIQDAVNAKIPTLVGRHFLLHNKNANYSNCYMTLAENDVNGFGTAPTADATDVNALWSFNPSGDGYVLTSAATGKSLTYYDDVSKPIKAEEEGLPYSIAYNQTVQGFNFTLCPTEEITDVSYFAIHQGGNSLVCKWTAGNIAGSHWMLEVAEAAEVNVELAAVVEPGDELTHYIQLPEGVELNTHASAANHVITITRQPAPEAQGISLFSMVEPVDGVHTIGASDFEEGTATLKGLEEGNYTLEAPAGMFLINGRPSAAINSTFAVSADGGVTGAEEVFVRPAAEREVIYDLMGRRVSENAKGLLIINGKKVYRL